MCFLTNEVVSHHANSASRRSLWPAGSILFHPAGKNNSQSGSVARRSPPIADQPRGTAAGIKRRTAGSPRGPKGCLPASVFGPDLTGLIRKIVRRLDDLIANGPGEVFCGCLKSQICGACRSVPLEKIRGPRLDDFLTIISIAAAAETERNPGDPASIPEPSRWSNAVPIVMPNTRRDMLGDLTAPRIAGGCFTAMRFTGTNHSAAGIAEAPFSALEYRLGCPGATARSATSA